MFESTGWIFEEPELHDPEKYELNAMAIIKPPRNEIFTENVNEKSELCIVQQYQFSSTLQRMSVIAQVRGSNEYRAYTKGSPEMILSLSKVETIPTDIVSTLQRYTEQGYRVIALGYSDLRIDVSEVNSKMNKICIFNTLPIITFIFLKTFCGCFH